MEKPKQILELEKSIRRSIPKVAEIDINTFGYMQSGDKVVGLGLYNSRIEDIKFLQKLDQLVSLNLSSNDISDYSIIIRLSKISKLYLNSNKIANDSPYKYTNLPTYLAMRIKPSHIFGIWFLEGLKNLEIVKLEGNNISDISCLRKLNKTILLDLSSNQISNLASLTNLKMLEVLKLQRNNIVDISCLKRLKRLNLLDLNSNKISNISVIKKLKNIQSLNISDNRISDISFLKELKNLNTLNISNNQISDISFLKELKNLNTLNISNNQISDISLLKDLKNLNTLNISNNQISDISLFTELKNINTLNLSNNQISNISYLKDLTNLKSLNLNHNNIIDISLLNNLKNLKFLNLSRNKVIDISGLENIRKLNSLDLSENAISKIPQWITEFSNMDILKENQIIENNYINLFHNPIESPPLEVVLQGKAVIKAWFAEQKKTKSISNPYAKMIIIGNTTVGKTSLINFLTKHTFSEGEITTHGIKQHTWKLADAKLDTNIWDFGGQEYYHSTHQLFFSNNTLYLLMFDKQHNYNGWLQTEIDYPDKGRVTEELEHFDYFYWLRNIRNLSDKSKILMLQNKVENTKDKVYPSNEVLDENLEYKVEDYQTTSVLNAYNYYKENQKYSYEFEELQKLIISKLNEVKRGEIFEYYLKAKELIEIAARTKPVVSIAELIEICKPANENIDKVITDENGNETEYTAWKLMCVYFHETGVLLYYPDSPTLKEKIFIRPTFVTDTIYKVLNYKVKQNFGRFTIADAVESLDNNTYLTMDIIELMSAPNFKLVFNYPAGSENYIVPQYLDDKKPAENILKHIVKNMEIGFSLEFAKFLPKYILTEFMVNYGRFQKDDIIWKYGIVFEKYGTTAFVECLFNQCKIVYKSDKKGEFERLRYEVFETLRNINRNDKNLKIGLDLENAYSLEKVLRDKTQEKFQLFQIGYEEYKKQIDGSLEKLMDKKLFLEKELTLAYDSEKKFALWEQVKELENRILELKK